MEDDMMTSGPVEYPTYHEVPRGLSFKCRDRGAGYYADPETQCQVTTFITLQFYHFSLTSHS